MSISDDDLLRLQDMLSAAHEVVEFTANASRADLVSNRMLFRAVSMSVGIIGEAASQLSEDFHKVHPEIPWRDIIGMRNFLFHRYHRIDHDILWKTATVSVVELIPLIEAILSPGD